MDTIRYNLTGIYHPVKIILYFLLACYTASEQPLDEKASETDEAEYKESKKKNYKALFIIHQCVILDNFEKVSDVEFAKEAYSFSINRWR